MSMYLGSDALQKDVALYDALARLEVNPDWQLVIREYTEHRQVVLSDNLHRSSSTLPQLRAIAWFKDYLVSIHDRGNSSRVALDELAQQEGL